MENSVRVDMECADLTWAKVAGHNYNVTHFEYCEIVRHIDPELVWMITETISNFLQNEKGETYRVHDLFSVIGSKLMQIISERENAKSVPPGAPDVANTMLKAYSEFPGHKGEGAYEITNTFLIYGLRDAIRIVRYFNR